MNWLRKLLARGRISNARRRLAKAPSPKTYAELAQEYAFMGMTRDVCRVCDEGLAIFPGSSELSRLRRRAVGMERDSRLAQLKRELSVSPRSAVWQEICEIHLDSGRLVRAEETAERWHASKGDPESVLMVARVRSECFFQDRGRQQGRAALEAIEVALRALPADPRAWRLKLEFTTRVGAHADARQCAAQLLQLEPGDPTLEARFRTLDTRADNAPTIDRALVEVESSGRLADEKEDSERRGSGSNVRPLLRDLAEEPDVEAALYVRGSTVLIHGPKGATAERTARAVRNALASGRTTARKLGLGQIFQIQLEGAFGTLAIAPSEMDAGAIWTNGHLDGRLEEALMGLAGLDADMQEVES
jgi:hypothetical protein